jgi:enamine deaminase RidA (YjgF/YER057c/UK114 family)
MGAQMSSLTASVAQELCQLAFARESAWKGRPHSNAHPEGSPPAMPHAITLIRSASLSSVAEYAYAASAPAGSRLIFLAGACPLNEDGATVAAGDYAGQAAMAFENMRIALADAGASVEDVLSTRVLVASSRQEDLVAAWEVIRDSFGRHDAPSTLMGVTVLGYKEQLVEIEAVAAVLDS